MRLLSYPFRLAPNGAVATVEQDSDQANAEQIAVLVLTDLGERPLAPGFGVTDPTFSELDPSEVAAAITEYGPDVVVGDITTTWDSDSTQIVEVQFD